MFKFFQKIRKTKLAEGKLGSYFRYAAGEILLVVIGILIALQINNWNQRKANNAKIDAILLEIQNNLLHDIEAANAFAKEYVFRDSLAKRILNDEFTADDYLENRAAYVGYNYWTFEIASNGYENLNLNLDNVPEHLIPLTIAIKKLYLKHQTNINDFNDKIRDVTLDNISNRLANYPWHLDFITGKMTPDAVNYFAKDPAYKNMVAEFMVYPQNIFGFSNRYKKEAIDLYIQIAHHLQNEIPEAVSYQCQDKALLNELRGNYTLVKSPNTMWTKELAIEAKDGQLMLSGLDKLPELPLRYHGNLLFIGEGDKEYIKFNNPEPGQFTVVFNRNYYAVYSKNQPKPDELAN